MPTTKSKTIAPTLMSDIEPPTIEEAAQWKKEHREKWMQRLWFDAHFDKDFALALCETITDIARSDPVLKNTIKERLKAGHRQETWTNSRFRLLLIHYALALEVDGNAKNALAYATAYDNRLSGIKVEPEVINNYISKAIKKLNSGEIKVDDWVREAIQERVNRGEKIKSTSRKVKSHK